MIPRILRIEVKNFRSIKQAAVDLEPFTVFVGPNGSGKSNFILATYFIKECFSGSIEDALSNFDDFQKTLFKGANKDEGIAFRIIIRLDDDYIVDYSFEITSSRNDILVVTHERCIVMKGSKIIDEYEIKNGQFIKQIQGVKSQIQTGRLALYAASATESFRPVYDFLVSMRYYNILPNSVLDTLRVNTNDDHLSVTGYNVAPVLKRLKNENERKYNRLCRLMKLIVNDVKGVIYNNVEKSIQFQVESGLKEPWIFDLISMSEGTLRVLGILLALYQEGKHSVICIEEPEAIVHPAVMEVLVQAMLEVAHERQVIIATHSPDILDFKYIKDKNIRVVTSNHSQTHIAPILKAGRKAIREHLYTPGELLRINELSPDKQTAEAEAQKVDIFGEPFSGINTKDV